jgi:hypothetical protein
MKREIGPAAAGVLWKHAAGLGAPVRTALALLTFCCCFGAQAGPPFLTDDPEPVELHHVEINLALQETRSDAARSGTLAADVNWGCAHEVQCHVLVPAAFGSSPGARMRSGIGDGEVGVKYRFFYLPDSGVMAAVYPTLVLPTGAQSRGLGNGSAQVLLPIWFQKSSGPWTWDAGVGYLLNRSPEARSSWSVSLLGQRSFGDALKVGAEVFHRTAVAQNAPPTTALNIGATVKLSAGRNLLASIGRGLQGVGANRGSVYLAYQLQL